MATYGKFEGEPAYTEYYWNLMLDGDCDDEWYTSSGVVMTDFVVGSQDMKDAPNLPPGTVMVCLWEDDSGFVYSITFDDMSNYRHYRAACESTASESV